MRPFLAAAAAAAAAGEERQDWPYSTPLVNQTAVWPRHAADERIIRGSSIRSINRLVGAQTAVLYRRLHL